MERAADQKAKNHKHEFEGERVAMLPSGLGWAVVRIVGIPNKETEAFPRVTLSGCSVLLGRSKSTGLGHFVTELNETWFLNVHFPA